jgi:DNA-binding NarL/FixJ family response regulator
MSTKALAHERAGSRSELETKTIGGLAPRSEARALMVGSWIALVDERQLVRDGFASLIRHNAPEINVKGYSGTQEIDPFDFSLFIIWIDQTGLDGARATMSKVDKIRQIAPQAPIAAFIERDDPVLVRCALNLGLDLIRLESITKEIAIGCVKLALAGGKFTSSELLNPYWFEPDARELACESSEVAKAKDAADYQFLPNCDGRYRPPATAGWLSDKLTPRELEILERLDRGLQNKTIAFELGISSCTVKVHIRNIMKKLNATNRTQVAFLIRQQTFDPLMANTVGRRPSVSFRDKLNS